MMKALDNNDIQDKNRSKKSCLKVITLNPYSWNRLFWDILLDLTFAVSFVLIPFVIANHLTPLEYLKNIEIAIDLILLINIITSFLTQT